MRDRRPVELSEVPKPLIEAVLATEDQTFYDNPGVDLQSMVRAFLENVDKGGVEQGGSTITQQLIKNRVFKDPKRDLDRKVKEAALAVRLNEEWSKNHILEEYLNTVYFGQGSYGVKAAAARFFNNTPLEKIDLAQAALLAGLIKNPEGDNPFDHPRPRRSRGGRVVLEPDAQAALHHDRRGARRRASSRCRRDPAAGRVPPGQLLHRAGPRPADRATRASGSARPTRSARRS